MIAPYINFAGHAQDAMDFYESVFHCSKKLIRKVLDMPAHPDYPIPTEMQDWIAHARLEICGTLLHFSDMQTDTVPGNMISLAAYFKTPEEVSAIYHKLAENGQIQMELEATHFAKAYAWIRDKFGVGWQLICE